MKVLIFGSNGMLGNYVKSYLQKEYEVIDIIRKDYDLTFLEIDTLKEFILSKELQENDVIINCVGVIPQSSKQRSLNTRLYFSINSLFPVILSMISSEYNYRMIHITTDCVFSGMDGFDNLEEGIYNENSIANETNDYGLSKSLGDLCKATIIRTSIIGEEINNKRSLLEWEKSNSGKEINGYNNHYWNGITCLQLAKIIKEIMDNNLYWSGIRHIFSPNIVSKYELLIMINNIYDLNIKINKIDTKITINKSLSTIYEKLFNIPDLSKQIKELKLFFK